MSNTAAPYGLRPVNLIGGQPYAGSTRLIKIASGATAMYFGQPVSVLSTGTIGPATVTTTAPATGVVGVFVGCTYTDPNLNIPVYKQYWPSVAVSDAYGYVVDDPDIVMQVQANGAVAQTDLGNNIALVAFSGSTSTGNSTTAASVTSGTPDVTAALPLRIVGFVESTTSTAGDAYTDILVKWNMPNISGSTFLGGHSYMNPTGL